VWGLRRQCAGAEEEEAAAAGRGEKGEMDREARLGLRGGKWLDRGLILQTLRAFFLQNRRQQVSAREGATDAPNSVVAAKAPPMLQILWWLQTGVGFKQP
jgi:hypothetical protein